MAARLRVRTFHGSMPCAAVGTDRLESVNHRLLMTAPHRGYNTSCLPQRVTATLPGRTAQLGLEAVHPLIDHEICLHRKRRRSGIAACDRPLGRGGRGEALT